MKVIDVLHCPSDYDCLMCKHIDKDAFNRHSSCYVCDKFHDITKNARYITKSTGTYSTYVRQRKSINDLYIICEDYEPQEVELI